MSKGFLLEMCSCLGVCLDKRKDKFNLPKTVRLLAHKTRINHNKAGLKCYIKVRVHSNTFYLATIVTNPRQCLPEK